MYGTFNRVYRVGGQKKPNLVNVVFERPLITVKRKYIAPKLLQAKALSDATNVLLGNTYYGMILNTFMYSVLWFNRVRTVAV